MGNFPILGIAASLSVAWVSSASAQATARNPCDVADSPFPLTDANRLDDRRLIERVAGKTFVVQRRLLQNLPPPQRRSFERVMTYYFRADGSLRTTCQHRKMAGGDLKNCEQYGPGARASAGNASDIAIWRIGQGPLCWHRSKNEHELCFVVHEQDGRGYARLEGGRRASCFEGEVSFR